MSKTKRYTPSYVVIAFGAPGNDEVVHHGMKKREAMAALKESHTSGGRSLMYGPSGVCDPEDLWGDSVFQSGDKD